MNGYLTALKGVLRREEGASMVEYGLLVALIALACIVTLGLIGTALNNMFGRVQTAVEGAGTGGGGTP
jgi:pilus assembly protein Flp/PilA